MHKGPSFSLSDCLVLPWFVYFSVCWILLESVTIRSSFSRAGVSLYVPISNLDRHLQYCDTFLW